MTIGVYCYKPLFIKFEVRIRCVGGKGSGESYFCDINSLMGFVSPVSSRPGPISLDPPVPTTSGPHGHKETEKLVSVTMSFPSSTTTKPRIDTVRHTWRSN